MLISKNMLLELGAEKIHYSAGNYIFQEGEISQYYFQIITGTIKLNNYDEEGREFIQGIYNAGESFAESNLFSEYPYVMSAITLSPTTILRLPRKSFLKLMVDCPEILMKVCRCIAQRLYFKNIMVFHNSCNPSKKILGLLNYFKITHDIDLPFGYQIPFTRQQIADFTGLRVETVIRTIKKLHHEKHLIIKNGKIFI